MGGVPSGQGRPGPVEGERWLVKVGVVIVDMSL